MTDLTKLQGAWNIDSLEVDGSEMPVPSGSRIVIQGERFESLGMGAIYEGTVEIDEGKKPKQFDLVFTAGPEKGNRSLGIYELDGDWWQICFTVTGKRRPSGFATSLGSGLALETLTRETALEMKAPVEEAAEPVPVPSTASGAAPEIEGEWRMIACRADGQAVPESIVKTGRRLARGGETSSWFGAQRILHARYTVDRSALPYAIDYSLKGGASQYGIWKFEEDVLHICFAPAGGARPTDFDARGGNGHTYTAWKRVK